MKKHLWLLAFLFIGLPARAQLSAGFEDGTLNNWSQLPDNRWGVSNINSLSGSYSLKHTYDNAAAATDIIYTALNGVAVNKGITQWRFLLRHGYNPSGTNKWAVFLFSNAAGSEWKQSGIYEGYAIGVNMVGTDDTLALYAVKNNTFSIIRKTKINWENDIKTTGTGAVEIIRNPFGEWTIKGNTAGNFNSMDTVAAPVTHNAYSAASYFGIAYTYTASADMLLWVDDIAVTFTRVVVPTKINTVHLQGTSDLLLSFTQPVDSVSAALATKYKLVFENDSLHPAQIKVMTATDVLLSFAQPLPRGEAIIKVSGVIDEEAQEIIDQKSCAVFYLLYGDIVINEIMATPVPSAGLPEIQYIELFNRLNVPVSLSGWKMEYITPSSGNTTSGNITATTIPARGYMILCSSSALDMMRTYGNATAVSYISSLTKSGKTLVLKNNGGQLMNRVTYSDKWIADHNKSSGGWSLEKIDAANLSETAANWAVSVSADGGTPGRINAVNAINPDKEAPLLSSFQLLDGHRLLLTFNELFDTLQAKKAAAYFVDQNIGNPQKITLSATDPLQVGLYFTNSFVEGAVYKLMIAAPFCDLAENTPSIEQLFGNMLVPQKKDIIINEVLFHPYSGGVDFVEIYNRSGTIFDLRQMQLANRDKNAHITSVYAITQQHYLHPGDYAVFTTSLDALQLFYSVRYPEKVIALSSMPSYPNESGCVVLLSGEDNIVDEFAYTEKMHSGFINNTAGISLERVHPDRPSDERVNWQSAAQDAGFATPTYRNSQYNEKSSAANTGFNLPYDVFSPDGDGYNDVLYIDYQMPASGYVASITIYDVQGRLVRELEKNTLLGISGRFAWDGTRHDNHRAALGAYIILIEAYDLSGNVQRVKKSCALATK